MPMDTQSIPQKFMRPRRYAQRVGVNWRTAYRYIEEGLWPAYKFQGVLLVDVDEVDAIIKGLTRRVPIQKSRVTKSTRKAESTSSQPRLEVAAQMITRTLSPNARVRRGLVPRKKATSSRPPLTAPKEGAINVSSNRK
jgi:hypothetical protein